MRGFKNFLMQGQLVVVAVGLSIALAFSVLVQTFTGTIITPLVNAAGGGGTDGLGVRVNGQLLDFGSLISAIVYFIVFMAVLYFVIITPYKMIMARRGETVFGDPAPVKTCPACLSDDIPAAASKCKYCATEQPAVA